MADRQSSATPGNGFATVFDENSDRFWHALWRRKWVAIAATGIGCAIGGALQFQQAPSFTSETKLLFVQCPPSSQATGDAVIISDAYLHAQAELIKSLPVTDMVAKRVQKLSLATLASAKSFSAESFSAESFSEWLPPHLNTRVDRDNRTVELGFTGPVARETATIVNAVVAAYSEYELQHRKQTAGHSLEQIQQEKDARDAVVLSLMQESADLQKRSPELINGNDRLIDPARQSLAKLTDELAEAKADSRAVRVRYEELAQRLGPVDSEAGTSEHASGTAAANTPAKLDDLDLDVNWIQSELNRASSKVDELTVRGLPPTDSTLQEARALVSKLREKRNKANRVAAFNDLSRLRQQVTVAETRQAQVQNAFDAQQQAVLNLVAKEAEFASLQAKLKFAIQGSQELGDKIKQLSVASVPPLDIRVLSAASGNGKPVRRWPEFYGGGALVGLALGLCLLAALEKFDQRLRTPYQIHKKLGLPILGVIPQQASPKSAAQMGMVAHFDPMSDLAESARAVRTSLFVAARTTAVKKILVTSAGDGEGKSVFSANLAISMAQAGSRVLLIDSSFSRPAISGMFDVRKSVGLSNVLAGFVSLDNVICRTSVERLEILPSGPMPPNSCELLNSHAFLALLEQVSCSYQCIIIDSPAVLSGTDTRIISAAVDVSLLIVRSGATRIRMADQAIAGLLGMGSRVLGAVVNGLPRQYAAARSRSGVQLAQSFDEQNFGRDSVDLAAPSQRPTIASAASMLHLGRSAGAIGMKPIESRSIPEVDVLD